MGMTRDEIINGLEREVKSIRKEPQGKMLGLFMTVDEAEDIITLLKEQEAVEPILKREGKNKNYNDYVCPICDNEVVYEQNYCSECGVKFTWEGR